MKRIAKFHKVSFQQFLEGWTDTFGEQKETEVRDIYESIRMPRRATTGSAGYDFFTPVDVTLQPGETIKIPTGIRAEMQEDWVLNLYPRSGLGFKYGFQFVNTIGLVDSDYRDAIRCKFTVRHPLDLVKGQKFMQGIIVHYKTFPEEKAPVAVRKGGFGSTGMF